MLRLGTAKASWRMSWPAVPSTSSAAPLRTDVDTGTSIRRSSRRVAVTITSCMVSELLAPALAWSAARVTPGSISSAVAQPVAAAARSAVRR